MRQVSFTAGWTGQNCHLQQRFSDILNSPFHTLRSKVFLCFKRIMDGCGEIIGYPFHQYAKSIIVSGTKDTREQVDKVNREWHEKWEKNPSTELELLRAAYEPVIIKAVAPNGDPIEGTFYRSKRSINQDLPTILCANPNLGGLSRSEGWDWLLRKGAKSSQPFHVIVFDYASCAAQGGALHGPQDLTLNADTFYQFAQNEGVSESNLHFFGFCSGAHVLASLAEMHPYSGRFVGFNASYSLAELIYRSPFNHEEMQKRRIPMLSLMKKIVYIYLKWSRWSMDVSRELNRICNRAFFVHHQEDRFVTPELRCPQVVNSRHRSLLLKTKDTVICRDPEYVTHWLPISLTEDGQGMSGSKRVLNFLLDGQVFQPRKSASSTTYLINAHKHGLKDIQKVKV